MSHWTRGRTIIKDLQKLKQAAENLGCTVDEKGKLRSSYAGHLDTVMVIKGKSGGKCAVVQAEDGYQTVLDNWNNPITQQIGRDASKLNQTYATEVAKSQAMLMGGVLASEQQLADKPGWVELTVNIP